MSTSDALEADASLEAHRLVARFLQHHSYTAALDAFLSDSAQTHPRLSSVLNRDEPSTGEDLQDVVDDWMATRLARLRVSDPSVTLREQLEQLAYSETRVKPARTALREATNVLTVTRGVLPRRQWDSSELRFRTCVSSRTRSSPQR